LHVVVTALPRLEMCAHQEKARLANDRQSSQPAFQVASDTHPAAVKDGGAHQDVFLHRSSRLNRARHFREHLARLRNLPTFLPLIRHRPEQLSSNVVFCRKKPASWSVRIVGARVGPPRRFSVTSDLMQIAPAHPFFTNIQSYVQDEPFLQFWEEGNARDICEEMSRFPCVRVTQFHPRRQNKNSPRLEIRATRSSVSSTCYQPFFRSHFPSSTPPVLPTLCFAPSVTTMSPVLVFNDAWKPPPWFPTRLTLSEPELVILPNVWSM
jgi:hypothetical protein